MVLMLLMMLQVPSVVFFVGDTGYTSKTSWFCRTGRGPASHSGEVGGLSLVVLAVLPSFLVLPLVTSATASFARADSLGGGAEVAALPPRNRNLEDGLPWESLGVDGGRGVSPGSAKWRRSLGEGAGVAELAPRCRILEAGLPWTLLRPDGGRGVRPESMLAIRAKERTTSRQNRSART